MKHAFVMNCHQDVAQALKTLTLLQKYWPQSKRYLYIDGPEEKGEEGRVAEDFRSCVDLVIRGPYEADKCQSILNALNTLVDFTAKDDVDVISFIHADMIPIYPQTFYPFLERFWTSGRLLTYCPMSPKGALMDFCNLHFRVRDVLEKNLFPIVKTAGTEGSAYDFNEFQVTKSFDRSFRPWKENSYPMWMVSWPMWQVEGIAYNGSFIFHNYVPETSIVHTNDSWFWNHYETLSVFQERVYPLEIR